MREGIPLINRDAMGAAVSHIQDDAGGPSAGIKRQHGGRGEEQGRGAKCFKYQLCQLSSVSRGVVRRFRKQQRMLFHLGIESLFVVHGVFQEQLHGIPPAVGSDAAAMQRVFQHEGSAVIVESFADEVGGDGGGGFSRGEVLEALEGAAWHYSGVLGSADACSNHYLLEEVKMLGWSLVVKKN